MGGKRDICDRLGTNLMTRSPIDQMTSKLWDFQTWESQLWGFKRIIGPIAIMIINLWRITRKTSKLRSRLWFHRWVIWWLEGGLMWKKQTKWPQRISRLDKNMHKITLRASLIIIPSWQHGQQQQSKHQQGYIRGINQRRQRLIFFRGFINVGARRFDRQTNVDNHQQCTSPK